MSSTYRPTEPRQEDEVGRIKEHIRQLVDSAPPLGELQRARLAALLRPRHANE